MAEIRRMNQNLSRCVGGSSFTAALALILLLASGCSFEADLIESRKDSEKFKDHNFESITETLKKADLKCSPGTACLESVGLIYNVENPQSLVANLHRCTGFLIADDIVATNSHCVPVELKSDSTKDCSKYLAIRFNESHQGDRSFACQSLISASSIDSDRRDFAFFRISPTGIGPLKISKNGLNHGEKLRAITITPVNNQLASLQEIKSCTVSLNSAIDSSPSHSFSEAATVIGCQIVPGNSGSPLLNLQNEVVGIVQAYKSPEFLSQLREQWKLTNAVKSSEFYDVSTMGEELPAHGLFSSFSCIDDPVTGQGVNELCAGVRGLKPYQCLDSIIEDDLDAAIKQFELELPEEFSYQINVNLKDKTIFGFPVCIDKEVEGDLSQFEVVGFRSWFYQTGVQPDFQIFKKMKVGKKSLSYVYNLKKFDQVWAGSFQGLMKDVQTERFPLKLGVCTSEQLKEKIVFTDIDYHEVTKQEFIQSSEALLDSRCDI